MRENNYRSMDRPLFILQYLMQNTDDDHKVTLAELMNYCEEHNHGASRNSICNDIEILGRYDFDIICTKETNKNYYSYGCRHLETAELRMLMDAVCSAPFLSPSKTSSLSRKLAQISSIHNAQNLCASVHIGKKTTAGSSSIFITIDVIHQAIVAGKKISFQQATYNQDRKRVLRNDGEVFIVSPYLTIWKDDRYYMVGWTDNHKSIRSFRVDRIERPQMMDEAAAPKPDGFDPDYYDLVLPRTANGDSIADITIECDGTIMNAIVDKFGDDFPMEYMDGQHFRTTVHVAADTAFYGWVFSQRGKVQIVAPEAVRHEYNEMLNAAFNRGCRWHEEHH